MILPVRRDALKERAALDEADEAEQYQRETPEQRFLIGLGLSELARRLAKAAGADWITNPPDDLADKARLYAEPLRRLCHPPPLTAARPLPGQPGRCWYSHDMKFDRAHVRQWIANFQAIEDADYEAMIKEGPKPAWSISMALSMIAAAEQMHGRQLADPLREEQDEAVQATWARLRRRLAA